MDRLINFVDILAYVLASYSVLIIICRTYGYITFDECDVWRNHLNGIETTFPVMNQIILLIVCACWLLSKTA